MKLAYKSLVAFGLSIMMAAAFMPTSAFAASTSSQADDSSRAEKAKAAFEKSLYTDAYDYVGKDSVSGEAEKAKEAKAYPDAFDLSDGRITGLADAKNVITPVKFQNPYGTCWGFAAIAAAEGSIINKAVNEYGGDKTELRENLDLSEKHLAWFANGKIEDESDSQYGEGVIWEKGVPLSDYYNTGGLPALATGLFSSGVGPVSESRVVDESKPDLLKYFGANKELQYKKIYDKEAGKYKTIPFCYSDEDDWTIPYDYRFYQSYKLEESFVLPNPAGRTAKGKYKYNEAGTNAIKDQLLQGRPVEIGFSADTSSPNDDVSGKYLNLNTWAHFTYDESAVQNHAVTIVGYDDNYSSSNFNEGHQPEADGAFLVKNSWGAEENEFPNKGAGWGIEVDGKSTGYFWISYYDRSLAKAEALDFDLDHPGDQEYMLDQYDYAPEQYPYTEESDDLIKVANVFKAEVSEKLFSVACQTAAPNTMVTYEVYILNDDAQNPEDGYLAAAREAIYEYGGFHKCNLDEEVIVQKGQKYSIVVTQLQPDGKYVTFTNATYTKAAYELYDMNTSHYGKAIVNENESFYYEDEEWNDFGATSEDDSDDDSDEDSESIIDIDNYPIKGYAVKCSNAQLRAGSSSITFNKPGEKSSIKMSFKGDMSEISDDTITWTSSDEKVATVKAHTDLKGNTTDATADVTAKGVGTAYIYGSNPEMGMVVIKVTVKAPAAAKITSKIADENGITIKWKKDDAAVGYILKYGVDADNMRTVTIKASKFDNVKSASYNIAKPKAYRTYKFVLRGHSLDGDGNKVTGKYAAVYVTQTPKTTSITSLTAAKSSFTAKWYARTCTGYQIRYSTSKTMTNATTKTIKGSANNTAKITGLTAGKTYYVKVRPYSTATGSSSYGSWSAVKTVTVK